MRGMAGRTVRAFIGVFLAIAILLYVSPDLPDSLEGVFGLNTALTNSVLRLLFLVISMLPPGFSSTNA